MKARTLLLIITLCASQFLNAEKLKNPKKEPVFSWDLLWASSWNKSINAPDEDFLSSGEIFAGGTLYNRGDLSLGLPRLDLSLRFLATDKRLLPLEEDDGKAGFNPGIGLYHQGSGSRLLYGVQSEYGLPARINNVWLRGIPFMESRSPSSRDLKTEPAAKDKSQASLYLALPRSVLPAFDAFSWAAIDSAIAADIAGGVNPAFGGGIGWNGKSQAEAKGAGRLTRDPALRLEGFYAQKELAQRNSSTWFSSSPPLPERDFHIYALGAVFNSSLFALASDWAWSETFAWGQGLYGNFALRLGNKPWRFSLAGDGGSDRFADRSGAAAGPGFRLSSKGEYFWPRSGLLRFQGTLRGGGLGESINRGGLSAYFRPSAPTAALKREKPKQIRLSRASLSINRDARKSEKTADTLNALAGFNTGLFSTVFSCSLHSLSSINEDSELVPLLSAPFFEKFDSFKVSGELGWRPPSFRFGSVNLTGRLGYTVRAENKNLWEPSINCSYRPGKWGRIGLKIASTDFPDKWNYTISCRFAYGDEY